MINYLLEVSLYQIILFAVYFVFFRRNTFFNLNRFILLGSVLLPFIFPFISLSNPVIIDEAFLLPEIVVSTTSETIREFENTKIYSYSTFLIVLGQILFSVFTAYKVYKLLTLAKSNNQIRNRDYILVETNNSEVFSWFSYIFVPKNEIKKEVLKHELVHVEQVHSIDILFIEFVSNILWFNPFLRVIKREMDLVHEYEADAKASAGKEIHYAEFLVKELFQVNELSLVHNFVKVNQIKSRIKMLTKMKTNRKKLFRYLLILPLVAMMALEYSCDRDSIEFEIEKKELSGVEEVFNFNKVDEIPQIIGIDENLSKEEKYQLFQKSIMNHVKENFKYPEEAKKQGINGRVIVSYVYDIDGKVKDVKILRGINKDLDEEAYRIVSSLPDVEPAYHDGKKVAVSFILPITFKLQ